MNALKPKLLFGIVAISFLFIPLTLLAEGGSGPNFPGGSGPSLEGGSGPNLPGGSGPSSGFTLKNPLNVKDFCGLLKAIFNVIVIFAIPIAVVMVVYAGLRFVWARGNPAGLTAAKLNLMWTLVGIALFFGAWFLAQVIANTLIQVGGSSFNTCF